MHFYFLARRNLLYYILPFREKTNVMIEIDINAGN